MRADTEQWVKEAPLEALQCRDLRHAWPRAMARKGKRKLENTANIQWTILAQRGDGTPTELERVMHCIGNCGVRRVETFAVAIDGSMVREGKPAYRHPKDYLRKRGKDEPLLERIPPDTLRGIVVRRLYPNLSW